MKEFGAATDRSIADVNRSNSEFFGKAKDAESGVLGTVTGIRPSSDVPGHEHVTVKHTKGTSQTVLPAGHAKLGEELKHTSTTRKAFWIHSS